MIVDEHHRLVGRHQSPRLDKPLQVSQLAIFKFSEGSLALLNSVTSMIGSYIDGETPVT